MALSSTACFIWKDVFFFSESAQKLLHMLMIQSMCVVIFVARCLEEKSLFPDELALYLGGALTDFTGPMARYADVDQYSFQFENEYKNVQRFRGGLVFKAHRLVYHSTLGLGAMKKKKERQQMQRVQGVGSSYGGGTSDEGGGGADPRNIILF